MIKLTLILKHKKKTSGMSLIRTMKQSRSMHQMNWWEISCLTNIFVQRYWQLFLPTACWLLSKQTRNWLVIWLKQYGPLKKKPIQFYFKKLFLILTTNCLQNENCLDFRFSYSKITFQDFSTTRNILQWEKHSHNLEFFSLARYTRKAWLEKIMYIQYHSGNAW